MNLYNLFSLIPSRIEYMNSENWEGHKPVIKIYDENQKQEILFENLFRDIKFILLDFKTLSVIWDDLVPYDGMSLEAKQVEILEWIGGKRNIYDILVIIKWLQKRCDVDNALLLQQIENEEVEQL